MRNLMFRISDSSQIIHYNFKEANKLDAFKLSNNLIDLNEIINIVYLETE